MILVDTSVWIDHLHAANDRLVERLSRDEVVVHPLVIAELSLGSIKRRGQFLEWLGRMRQVPTLSSEELRSFVEARRLWGRGLNVVDAHLLGSILTSPGVSLWTRDRRLRLAAGELGVGVAR